MSLSAKKRKYIQLLCEPVSYTQDELAEKLGISDRTIRRWQKNDEINQELQKELRRHRPSILNEAYSAVRKRIQKGDTRAILWILENWDESGTRGDSDDADGDILREFEDRMDRREAEEADPASTEETED